MSQKIHALPDVNREDNTPDVLVAVHNIGADVTMSDRNRNTALPDANQERVLPPVEISTGSPLMMDGRYDMIGKNGVTGNIQQVGTPHAVGPQAENIKKSTQYLHDDTNDGPKANTL